MSRITSLFTLLSLLHATLSVPTSGTSYSISPASFPELCVAPAGGSEGSALTITSCDDASSDIAWNYNGVSLQNSAINMCIDITGGEDWSGNLAQVWQCYTGNQHQMFMMDGDLIKWSGKGMCLDLTDGKGEAGTKVQIWTCGSSNPHQQWVFNEVEEVDGCHATTSSVTAADVMMTAAANSTASVTASLTSTAIYSSNSASGTLGVELLAGASGSGSSSKHHYYPQTGSSSSSSSARSGFNATDSATYSTAFNTEAAASSATASASATDSNVTATSTTSSGSLQVSGTAVVDSNGNIVKLRGTNLGGWLVIEDWMCGITDESGSTDRFSQTTLETRFGVDQTHALLETWYDNWLVSSDFDNIAALGFNVVRLPFGFRNLQWQNGSWITDSSGNVDFSRLDWAVAQAKSRGIYVIPVFHIWDGQEAGYSTISEDSDEGQTQRDAAGEIWKKVAAHFIGESTIAAYDAINEPTGSANDQLQRDLYTAIRSVDANRIIVMESISTDPSTYGWNNTIYSFHEYLMMGSDSSYNEAQWNGNDGASNSINTWLAFNIPVYIAEFMADGSTLDFILGQCNNGNLWWSGWTYKTVNMDRWGLYNFGGFSVDVSSDSYSSIQNQWSNMGGITRQAVADQYQSATSKKRSLAVRSPRVGETRQFHGSHKSRSRRGLQHRGSSRF